MSGCHTYVAACVTGWLFVVGWLAAGWFCVCVPAGNVSGSRLTSLAVWFSVAVVLFCAQRQYKLYLSCIPCLFHVLHAMP